MKPLAEYQQIVLNQLQQLESERKAGDLYEPIWYLLSRGGKRLRPVLTLIAADFFDGDLKKAEKPALGIELFHNFTLLQDDIMDEAPIRRGNPTVHIKWDLNSALLSGDVVFVQAFGLVTSCDVPYLRAVLDLFNETAIQVCEGQRFDLNFEQEEKVQIASYIEMIKLKTAVLVGCALKLGAILADADPKEAQLLYDFGLNLGIAFQIQDDILDVFGDEQQFGKQIGGDILANKKTYLLLKALEEANKSQEAELYHWMRSEDVDPNRKVQAVTTIFADLKVKEQAEKVMWSYYDLALDCLSRIEVNQSKKDYLIHFAQTLIKRTY